MKDMNETDELFLKLTEIENQTNFDEKIKAFMGLKLDFGEFSLDVYYNDISAETEYTAKLIIGLFADASLVYHSRKSNMNDALNGALHALVDLFFSNNKIPYGWEFITHPELRKKEHQIKKYQKLISKNKI